MNRVVQLLKKNKVNIILFTIMTTISLIIFYFYYPGIITYDGNIQWNEVITGKLSNSHPFFSTYFMYLLSFQNLPLLPLPPPPLWETELLEPESEPESELSIRLLVTVVFIKISSRTPGTRVPAI